MSASTAFFSGAQLRKAREHAGLTREEVAVAVHRSAQSVYRWEAGLASPPPTVVGALRRLLALDDVL